MDEFDKLGPGELTILLVVFNAITVFIFLASPRNKKERKRNIRFLIGLAVVELLIGIGFLVKKFFLR